MAFSWPDISQNQLFQAGLGLVGAGTSGGRVNPFQAASQGIMYGKQLDLADKEQARLDADEVRRKKLEDAWNGMFGLPGGGAGIVEGGLPPELDPLQQMQGMIPGGGGAMSSLNAAGMRQQQTPAPNPALAGYTPQQLSFLQAMGPEKGAAMLWEGMNKPREKAQDASGFWRYVDTGERVFPDAEKPKDKPPAGYRYGESGNLEADPGWLAAQIQLRQAGRPETNVTVGGGDKFGEEWAKATVGRLNELEGKAQDAVATLQGNQEALGILDQGIISGAGADWRLGAAKLAAQAGFDVDTDPIAATEAYFANRAKAVALMVKNFGSGAGITDADREFAAKAAAGDIQLSEKAMRRIIEINNKVATAQIKAYNDYAARVREQRPEEGKFIMDVQMPEMPTPQQYNVPPPSERKIGTFYNTPKGRALWTGEGWQLEKDVPGGGQ